MPSPRPSALALAHSIVSAVAAGRAHEARSGADLTGMTVKLEAELGKLIGSNGYDVLLSRALKLAARENQLLAHATAGPGGAIAGLPGQPADLELAMVCLTAHVCELLMKFIGEDLATRVFRNVWPEAAPHGAKERHT